MPPDAPRVPSTTEPDVLYVQVGDLSPLALRESHWPSVLPDARRYVATWRANEPQVPPRTLIPQLAAAYRVIRAEATASGQRLGGLQLDIDCPTRSLGAYGDFLRRLRAELAPEDRLSVTALLDWFLPGTRVRDVVANVDEYVPQFYDARPGGPNSEIGERLDPERWAPVFNRFDCPYRIGLSTFGRIQRVRPLGDGGVVREAFRDLTLVDLMAAGLIPTEMPVSRSGERRLQFDVGREIPPALRSGDRIEAILPTREGVRTSYAEARKFGGLCTGVVFFRWPAPRERLTLSSDEVADAIGSATGRSRPRLDPVDGGCQTRACTDLRVHLGDRFPSEPLHLRVKATADVDYLVPVRAGVTLRQTSPREITIRIPPFFGESDLLLGRAFSQGKATYQLTDEGS
jgi:hypothetical protein